MKNILMPICLFFVLGSTLYAQKIEAESFNLNGGYAIQNHNSASSGQIIKASNENSKTIATKIFTGRKGLYELKIKYFDDKESYINIFIDNKLFMGTFILLPSGDGLVKLTANICIDDGAEIKLTSSQNTEIDYIELFFDSDLTESKNTCRDEH